MDGNKIIQKLDELGLFDARPLYNWYLPLLAPALDGPDGEELLGKFRALAKGLRDSPEFISELIRDRNWRPTILGAAVVILLRAVEFQEDMAWRLANWNWVAPQLAAGIAIVDQGNGTDLVRVIVETATEDSNPKVVMSAYSALLFMKSPVASEFEASPLFEYMIKADSWDGSHVIAKRHWDFWSKVKPIN